MSLRGVAAAIGVSPSLLSQIENGKSNPSVDTLYALVQQLRVSVDALLGIEATGTADVPAADTTSREPIHLQRHEETPVIDMHNGVRWERLAVVPGRDVEALRVTYEPGASSSIHQHLMHHSGVEHLVMISGELIARFGDNEVTLRAGDSMVFDSRQPHLYTNLSDRPALGIWHVVGGEGHLSNDTTSESVLNNAANATGSTYANPQHPHSALEPKRAYRKK